MSEEKKQEATGNRRPPVATSSDDDWRKARIVLACLAVIAVVAAVLVGYSWGKTDNTSTSATPAATAPVSASVSDCTNGYPLQYDPSNPNIGDVIQPGPDGIAAKDAQDLEAAAKKNPMTLAFYANVWMPSVYPDKSAWQPFADSSGKCMSPAGVDAYNQLVGAISQYDMAIGQADPSWTNSGMGGNGAVVNSTPGISGNLTAMIFTDPKTGNKIVIMERCGNPVFPAPPSSPPPTETTPPPPPVTTPPPPPPDCTVTGTCPPPCEQTGTCQPPPCEETGTCTPPPPCTNGGTPPLCLQPKDPSVDPYPRGNAPQGGGQNDQPGPGTYRPPASMPQPPSTPRVNPPPPVVTGSSAPKHVTTPVTAPPPEAGVNGSGTGAGSTTVTHPNGSTSTVVTGTVAPPK